jgi:hypothetical protein
MELLGESLTGPQLLAGWCLRISGAFRNLTWFL